MIAHWTVILKRKTNDLDAYYNRGVAYNYNRNFDLALKDFTEAIKLNPTNWWIYFFRGVDLNLIGNFTNAISDFTEAIKLKCGTNEPGVYYMRGETFLKMGQIDAAIHDYTKGTVSNPKDSDNWKGLGDAYLSKNNYLKALSYFTIATRFDPKNLAAYHNLIWLYAACPDASIRDGKHAVAVATTACHLTEWKQSEYIFGLAAAFAEDGDFDQAIKYEEQAMSMQKMTAKTLPKCSSVLTCINNKKAYHATTNMIDFAHALIVFTNAKLAED